ncbi:hypothetical protein ACSVHC_00630 [Arthrobacter sp. KNU-44]|uniref:hypothetical protein n=1 Tax=Arthrobacter sp. KNU-44 TaxID=3450744 RepID=UPI003F43580A
MSSASHAGNVDAFKARTNLWFALLSWAVNAFGFAVTVVMVPGASIVTTLFELIAFLGWQIFRTLVRDGGVTLENPFGSIVVSWSTLVYVDTRFALTLNTVEKSHASLIRSGSRDLGRP